MKVRIGATLVGLLLCSATLLDADQAKPTRQQPGPRVDVSFEIQNQVNLVFTSQDVLVIREHYKPRYRNLAKGSQKKLAKDGHLPAGWQRNIEPFPIMIERKLVALPVGYRRGVIDGNAVIYSPRTQVIFDAATLF